MTRYVMLNNVAHQDLKIITRYAAEFGDNVGTVLTFPTEYADVQREYPIFFRKDRETGDYQSIALLGFEKNENLFLDDTGWQAAYVPGMIAKGPFLIGFQERQIDGELRRQPVIHIDLDHPKVGTREGESVFQPHGGNSPYLENIATVLRGISDGVEASKAMFAAFTALDLIQPVNVEIKLDQEHGINVTGLYSIDRARLAALDGERLFRLNQAGYLEGAFLVLASMNNVRKLMALKQRRKRSG
jgi:hypothetical protein